VLEAESQLNLIYHIFRFVASIPAPPKFSKTDLGDTVTLNLGASKAIEFPFTANPQPKVTWTYNGEKLPDPKRFKTQTISCMTSITISKVVLKDAGDYKVTLENENGQATYSIKLIVLGESFTVTMALSWHTVPKNIDLLTCLKKSHPFIFFYFFLAFDSGYFN